MDFQMTKEDFVSLLNRLSVAHTIERINDGIIHIKIWHNGKPFRARFVDAGDWYEFTNWLEG